MQQTPNNDIKIVRLHSGEDIMASYLPDEEAGVIHLFDPMHIIFKRIPTGQTVMMMMPWLPVEIIKENVASIYNDDILTIIEPKDDLIEYYGSIVLEAQQRMEQKVPFYNDEEDDDEDEDDLDPDELLQLLKEKKKSNLH